MFRIQLARFFVLGATLFVVGCNSCGGSSSGQPGLLTRFRMAINPDRPVAVSNGECCDHNISSGPMLPGMMPGNVLPNPQQNIPRIDENGKQMPWDGKTSRPGNRTGNEVKTTKEGT